MAPVSHDERLLKALQGLAESLHKSKPAKVLRPPGLNPTEIIAHNIKLVAGRSVSIDTTDFLVPERIAHAIKTHFGATNAEIIGPTVSGSRRIKKATWVKNFR